MTQCLLPMVRVVGEAGGENIVRLLTFLPGKILHQVPYTAQLFFEGGALVARIDNELKVERRQSGDCRLHFLTD